MKRTTCAVLSGSPPHRRPASATFPHSPHGARRREPPPPLPPPRAPIGRWACPAARGRFKTGAAGASRPHVLWTASERELPAQADRPDFVEPRAEMSAKQIPAQPGCARLPAMALVLALAVTLVLLQAADAKRSYGVRRPGDIQVRRAGGCMAFGHSCFGGHGKRADMEPGAEGVEGAEEAAAVAEAAAAAALLDDAASPQRFRLSPFLRQWLQRAYQQQPADSQTVEVK
ncbi:uncharacterized protein LOC126214882 [Schistocerca nitens]|uniref:uncharacterized protein LOC126214882 n=1 Tax=Schistocerca nitens TaxID=7011 RepID=UPI002119305D|nr:uncharacterized protein LOC126214882 [Schistocerca nitens]